MKTSSLIGHVAELYGAVKNSRSPADAVVRDFFRARHYLGSRDRRFISEAIFGMLRHSRLIGAWCEGMPDHPLRRYAVYAVRILGEPEAAVAADIETLWSAYVREGEPAGFLATLAGRDPVARLASDPVRATALRHSFPDYMVREWADRLGIQGAEALCDALNRQAPTVVRANALRCTREECLSRLASGGVTGTPAGLAPLAIVLQQRTNLTGHSAYREGWFEVQDEGSQLVSHVVNPRPGETIVDACAGGGGKTLHCAALMMNEGRVVATDVSARRLEKLTERIRRAGATIVTIQAPQEEGRLYAGMEGVADAVLVDAPCTGSGTYRRNPGAKAAAGDEFPVALARTQLEILTAAASMVRPGGRLVYSTCSLLQAENEEVVAAFLSRAPSFIPCSVTDRLRGQEIEIQAPGPYLTLFPHIHGTDGFFVALLERAG